MTSMRGLVRPAILAAATLLVSVAGASAAQPGYFDSAGAPLVAPTLYNTGDAQATAARQKASGYFADAGDPLVAASAATNRGGTLERQRATGYFPDAGAPLVSPTTTTH
ncbi:MAG TPA: hypothetical protein VLX85_08140 [Stellaceae bacterium]|nr:hypothetical protein [Stellaceae bacterium]